MSYLRLLRLPNVFTAIADVAMGFLLVHQSLTPGLLFACLSLASVLLYFSGMVLNDVWDIEVDRRMRPDRPLPSGAIALGSARRLGFGLLMGGVACGWLAGHLNQIPDALWWRSGVIATLLALNILLYDRVVKRTILGPLGMGACRFLNVLLGMAVAAPADEGAVWLGYGPHHLLAATGIGVYIVGVTWFARQEAGQSSRTQLALGTVVMASGIACLGLINRWLPADLPRQLSSQQAWLVLLGLVALTVIRRSAWAITDPSPRHVQRAVKHAIWSLIVLDATVALLVSPPIWTLLVLLLLVPTVVLGQWIEST